METNGLKLLNFFLEGKNSFQKVMLSTLKERITPSKIISIPPLEEVYVELTNRSATKTVSFE